MDLLLLNTLQNLSLADGIRLGQTIRELNILYQAEFNVFLEFGNGSDILEAARQPLLPSLWLSNIENQIVMEGNFSSCTLTILYLEEPHLNSGLDYLTKWLWKYQHLYVLIFYKDGTDENLTTIFKRCFGAGLLHVIVMLPNSKGLYSFLPYENFRILHLANVMDYHITSKLNWNFRGHNITSGLVTAGAPRWYSFRDRNNKLILTGYMLRMIMDFTRFYNGSVQTRNVSTVNEGLQILDNRSIDFFPFLIRPLEGFQMTNIMYLENCGLIVPSSRRIPNYLYLVRPYSLSTWLTWLIIIGYCSLALRILTKGKLNLSGAFLNILRLVLYLSGGKDMGARPSHHRCLLFIILTTSGFILTNLYLAQLSSNLATGLYEKQVNSWQDLDETDGIWPLIDVDVTTMQTLIPDRHKLISRIVITSEQNVDMFRRNLNTSCIHSGFFDRLEFALYQQKFLKLPIFRKFPHILYQQPLQISTSFGRPYLQLFNWFSRRTFESGIFLKMKEDAYLHGIQSGLLTFDFRDKYLKVKSNNLEYYYLVAGFWLGGLFLALISFFVELLLAATRIKVTVDFKLSK
ncbi:hypothetical protein KR200_007570 [Drosophila serrata]|nr:hypothetical protein KR200_007570 [Drosophila serrata]